MRCGTGAVCECGHLLALHMPPVGARGACRGLTCTCGRFRARDDAARERERYEAAMRGDP